MLRRHLPILAILATLVSGTVSWIVSEPADPSAGWRIERIALSPSGRWIGVGSASGWIGIIDQTAPEGPQRFRAGPGQLRDLRFTADERWLVMKNDALWRHPVTELGSLEPASDPGQPQHDAVWNGEHSSNVVSGSGLTIFGNAAGSIEVHDERTRALLRRFTFR